MKASVLFRGPDEHEPPLHVYSLLETMRAFSGSAAELILGSEVCELPPLLAVGLQGLVAALPELDDALEAFNVLVGNHDVRSRTADLAGVPDPTVPLISGMVERIGRNLHLATSGFSQLFDLAQREAATMDAATIELTAGRARVLPFTMTVMSLGEAQDTE